MKDRLTFEKLMERIRKSAASGKQVSRVKELLYGGPVKYSKKVVEEAGEFMGAMLKENNERVVAEAADVLFHVGVCLVARNVKSADVAIELAERTKRATARGKRIKRKVRKR